MVHRSRKDSWLVIIVSLAVLLPPVVGTYIFFVYNFSGAGLALLLIGVFSGTLILLFTYPLYYEITPLSLIIRSGVTRTEIPLSSITEAIQTRDPLSAPAWSLDRVQISYVSGNAPKRALISPKDKLEFMRELATSANGLKMSGDRVVRVR